MSTDIQAPDLSLNVRYSKGDKKNRGEIEESHVEIYENEHSHIDLGSNEVTQLTQNNNSAVKRSGFRAVILGVLYLLILAGIFMRYIFLTLEPPNVWAEREQLNISLKQLQTRNINLTKEKDRLQTRFNILSKNYSQLENEQNKLKAEKLNLERQNEYLMKNCKGYVNPYEFDGSGFHPLQ